MGAVGSWYQQQIDGSDDGSTWPTLNPTGLMSEPETARWSNGAFTEPQARAIIQRVCSMTGTTLPTLAQWNSWTKEQKYAWLRTVQDQLFTGSGIWLDLADNEAVWDAPEIILDQLGLKVRRDPAGAPA